MKTLVVYWGQDECSSCEDEATVLLKVDGKPAGIFCQCCGLAELRSP